MKDTGKDKFEQFFQDNLKDYNSSPSEDLWTELEHRIPPPPKSSSSNRKVGGWFYLLFGIVLLFSMFQWWIHDNEIENINQQLGEQEQKISSISSNIKKGDKKISEVSIELSEDKKEPIAKNKGTTRSNQIQVTKKNNRNKLVFEKNKNTEFENVNTLLSVEEARKETTNKIPEKIENEIPDVGFEMIAEAGKIDFLNIFLDAPMKLLELNEAYELIDFSKSKPISRSSFEPYRNYSWVFPQLELENGQSTSLPSRNTNIGLFYNVHLNKRWILQFGIGYGKQYTGLKFQKTFEYAETEVFINTDLVQTKYAYEFDSNYGRQLFTSFILNEKENDGQDVVTDDPFTMEIQVVRRQRYLTTPILVKYLWTNTNKRIKGSFKAGVFQKVSFYEDERGEISVNSISNSRLKYDKTNITQLDITKTKNLNFILGAGVECKLDDRFVLIVEPNFKKSIIGFGEAPPYSIGFYTGLRWNIF